MSSKKRQTAEKLAKVPPSGARAAAGTAKAPPRQPRRPWWPYLAGIVAALAIAFEVYGPALSGPFLFDDLYLPFATEDRFRPLVTWLSVRPVLMTSYWLNMQASGHEPFWYHAVNVLLHVCNAVLVWLCVRRLLSMAGQSSELLAILAAALFLLHPVQTESVAYIAGRSETLSVFFFLLAYTAFLYRLGVLAVLLPFFAAVLSKEHTVVLPALLLLTDFVFGGSAAIRRNLKLYVPIALLGLLGAAVVLYRIANAPSAGFGLKEFTWYQYLFTQFSVIWTYLRLFVLPVGLTADYQYPVSRTILDNGAIFWGLGLLALAYVAWRYRRTYPLAFLGFVAFLLLLAPTSSVVPIADVIAERRLYLPMLGLLLVVVDVVRRAALPRHTVAAIFGAILLAAAFATHSRASVWGDPIAFWQDTVNKGEGNARARFQLAFAQWQAGRCSEAAANFEKTAQMRKPDTALYVDWALALDCENRPDEAVAKLREALKAGPNAHVLGQIGMIYGKRGRFDEALVALDEAEKVDPMFDVTYVYKGNVYAARGDRATAESLYKRALSINPNSETALSALQALR